MRWRRRRGGGIHFNADAHHETAIIKDRIERNDDKIEAFFDSIDPERTFSLGEIASISVEYVHDFDILRAGLPRHRTRDDQ